MKAFLKIDKRVLDLNDSQAFIYLLIVYKDGKAAQESKTSKTSKKPVTITREYFGKCLGISVTSVSNNLKKIEDAGLIERKHHFNNAREDGYINQTIEFIPIYSNDNWYKVNPFIINSKVDPKLKGFALRYRCLAFDDSLVVGYGKSESAQRMHISRPTFRKYFNLIEEENLINTFFIPVQNKNSNEVNISEASMNYLKDIQSQVNSLKAGCKDENGNTNAEGVAKWIAFQNTPLFRQFKWVVQNRIWTRKNGDKIIEKIMAGLLTPKKIEETKSENIYNF